MIKFFNWLFARFGYELIHWETKLELEKKVLEYKELIFSTNFYPYIIIPIEEGYQVVRDGFKGKIIIKNFKAEDYGSMDYAFACAEELKDKLNEKPYMEDVK